MLNVLQGRCRITPLISTYYLYTYTCTEIQMHHQLIGQFRILQYSNYDPVVTDSNYKLIQVLGLNFRIPLEVISSTRKFAPSCGSAIQIRFRSD